MNREVTFFVGWLAGWLVGWGGIRFYSKWDGGGAGLGWGLGNSLSSTSTSISPISSFPLCFALEKTAENGRKTDEPNRLRNREVILLAGWLTGWLVGER